MDGKSNRIEIQRYEEIQNQTELNNDLEPELIKVSSQLKSGKKFESDVVSIKIKEAKIKTKKKKVDRQFCLAVWFGLEK